LSEIIGEQWPQTELIITSGKHARTELDIPDAILFLDKPYTLAQVIHAIERMQSAKP
jgi:hypothetical protein